MGNSNTNIESMERQIINQNVDDLTAREYEALPSSFARRVRDLVNDTGTEVVGELHVGEQVDSSREALLGEGDSMVHRLLLGNDMLDQLSRLLAVSGVYGNQTRGDFGYGDIGDDELHDYVAPKRSKLITVDDFNEVKEQVRVLTLQVNALMELLPKKFSTMVRE